MKIDEINSALCEAHYIRNTRRRELKAGRFNHPRREEKCRSSINHQTKEIERLNALKRKISADSQ